MNFPRASLNLPTPLYGVVRAYGVRGILLPPATLTSLAEAADLEDFVNRLKTTVYTVVLGEEKPPYEAQRLEQIFRRHLVSLHLTLVKAMKEPVLLRAYFNKYLASNLKVALRNLALGKGWEEARAYIDLYAEELVGRRDVVVKALSARSLDEAATLLAGGEFGEEVEGAVKAYRERGDLQIIDVHVDRAFYRRVSEAYKILAGGKLRAKGSLKPIYSIVAADVDGYNILAALRGKLWQLSASRIRELFVEPGFHLLLDQLEDAAASSSLEEAMQILAKLPYRRLFEAVEATEAGLRVLEDRFEEKVLDESRRAFTWHAMEPSTILAAVKLKEEEVKKLAAIAFGVEQRLGVQRILERLKSRP